MPGVGKVQDVLLSNVMEGRLSCEGGDASEKGSKKKKGKQNKTRTGRFEKLRAKAEAKKKRGD